MAKKHWTEQTERGSLIGIKILFFLHKIFGNFVFKLILYPVIFYFYLTGTVARRSSKQYLKSLQEHFVEVPELSSFQHFMQFADAILDKLNSWSSNSDIKVLVKEPKVWSEIRNLPTGAIFLGAHMGNLDACRNGSKEVMGGALNALMLTENASKFISLIKQLSPEFEKQVISVSSVGPETAILLQEKLENKEHIFILADRIPQINTSKQVNAPFIGKNANFGTGPFILATILKAPVYFISALKFGNEYHLHLETLKHPLQVKRSERNKAIEKAVVEYAQWLEKQCEKAPLQWYNFYPFWQEIFNGNK